jgi:hypothetical protein
VSGGDVYSSSEREEWLSKLPQSARLQAELLALEYGGRRSCLEISVTIVEISMQR